MPKSLIETDIAVIKNTLGTIQRDINAILAVNKDYDNRITESEKKQASIEQKVSNFAFLQAGLSIIIGAVAAFLGVNRK